MLTVSMPVGVPRAAGESGHFYFGETGHFYLGTTEVLCGRRIPVNLERGGAVLALRVVRAITVIDGTARLPGRRPVSRGGPECGRSVAARPPSSRGMSQKLLT